MPSSRVAARAIDTKEKFMLRSNKQINGDKLGAFDGEVGLVKDFYFDDKHLTVRYAVTDTGSWI